MSKVSGKEWKKALTNILEELDKQQYNKMLQFLGKIPKSKKAQKFRENMPQIIIEVYGEEKSISAINRVMKKIPRKDAPVQRRLRPFVDKVRNNRQKEKKDTTATTAPLKMKHGFDPLMMMEMNGAELKKSFQPDQGRSTHGSGKKTIRDVKSRKQILDSEFIVGKVLQKSGLCTYETTEMVEKPYFHLAVADETDSIKVMVYGNKRYSEIEEEKSYLFSKLLTGEDILKVSSLSIVSETNAVKVPAKIEKTARTLVCPESPECSITEVKISAGMAKVSITGTITEIYPAEEIEMKEEDQRKRKTKRQVFQLKDDTDSIRICMWGENTQQCKGLVVGDVIKLTNMKTNYFHGVTSLNSTGFTRIYKVQSAGLQNGRIEIKGITKTNKTHTHLQAEFNQQLQMFIVDSRLLAKALAVKLDGNFKERLVDKIPLSAIAEIQGNEIHRIECYTWNG